MVHTTRHVSRTTFWFVCIHTQTDTLKTTPAFVIVAGNPRFCRAMLCKRGLSRHAVSVCLSVCLSVTFVHSVKTNKHSFKIFSPSGSHTILVFLYQTLWHYSDGEPPNGGAECTGVWKNGDFRPIIISLYLGDDARQSHSYCWRRIGNRTQAFEWYQFEWPLTQTSRSRYYSTSNNSKTVQDRAIFTMADQ